MRCLSSIKSGLLAVSLLLPQAQAWEGEWNARSDWLLTVSIGGVFKGYVASEDTPARPLTYLKDPRDPRVLCFRRREPAADMLAVAQLRWPDEDRLTDIRDVDHDGLPEPKVEHRLRHVGLLRVAQGFCDSREF